MNESKTGIFQKVLDTYVGLEDIELIVSDGGSTDETLSIAEKAGAKIVRSHPSSRAQRINDGVRVSSASLVLLNHPRSVLERDAPLYLIENNSGLVWGGFRHKFDYAHPVLNFTSWYSNTIRPKTSGVLYLDHCKYIQKTLLEKIGPIPPVEIFEDTILSNMLKRVGGKPKILPFESLTSSVRFKKNGVFKQVLINQLLKIQFHLGKDHRSMNKLYERNTSLNTERDDAL